VISQPENQKIKNSQWFQMFKVHLWAASQNVGCWLVALSGNDYRRRLRTKVAWFHKLLRQCVTD